MKNPFKILLSLLYIVAGIFAPLFAAGSGESSEDPVTTHVIDAKSSQLLTKYIRKNITKLEPNNTPLDQLFRLTENVFSTKSWENDWYTSDVRQFFGDTNGGVSAGGAGAAAGDTFTVAMVSGHWIIAGDVLRFQGIAGGDATGAAADATLGDFCAWVSSKSTNTLTLIAINGYNTSTASTYGNPAIADGTTVLRIGNAQTELAAQVTPYSVFPTPSENYAQRQMKQVEESLFATDASKEVKWDINDHKMHAFYDLRSENEYTLIYGKKKKLLNASSEYVYLMDGFTPLISKTYEFAAAPTNATLNSFAKYVFAGNNGSPTRWFLVGSDLMATLATIPTYEKQVEAMGTKEVLGIEFNKIVTNYGSFLIKYHAQLDHAGWGDKGMVIDPAKIVKGNRKPLTVTELKLREAGTRNVKALLIDETWTNFLLGPDDYHCLVTTGTGTGEVI